MDDLVASLAFTTVAISLAFTAVTIFLAGLAWGYGMGERAARRAIERAALSTEGEK